MYNPKSKFELKWKKNQGVIAILMTISLPVLLIIVGLAVDSAMAYGLKAKLSSAVDAASLAAAKAVYNGEAAAVMNANKYFDANFPTDFFYSTLVGRPKVNFAYSSEGDITIDVSATVNMPTFLIRLAGINDIDIFSSAQTVRRVVDLSLVVDNTTSLVNGTNVTQDVIDRSKDFIGNFHQNLDRIALVKYAYGAEVPVPFDHNRGFNKANIETEIDAFDFGSSSSPQYTNSSEGMWRAIDQLVTANNPASLRVIVFFTDGSPNTFSSNFSFNGGTDAHIGSIRSGDRRSGTPYGMWNVDSVAERASTPWYFKSRNNYIYQKLSGFPQYYNAHDPSATDFLVINPNHPRRPVTDFTPGRRNSSSSLYQKVNRISRNLPEDMAEYARKNGIFVLTLGLGASLTQQTGPDNERGDEMLMRMANDPKMLNYPALAGDFKANQPQGVYCYAVDKYALAPCFSEMLAIIIRLTL